MHRPTAVLLLAASTALAACTSSGPSAPKVSSAVVSRSPSVSTAASAPSAPAPTATVVSTAPAGADASSGLPAVGGATDLAKQPTITVSPGPTPSTTLDAAAVLIVRDLVVGTGAAASAGSSVTVKYVGVLESTGTVFQTSWGSATNTVTLALTGVIPGFARGIAGMRIGGRREIVVPPALGYGSQSTGSIPADSTLVFVVDLTAVTA